MKIVSARPAQLILAVCVLAASSASMAASTWNFSGNGVEGTNSGCGAAPSWGNTLVVKAGGSGACNGSGAVVTASAWASPTMTGNLATAQLTAYSGGIGIQDLGDPLGSPDHSTDNAGYTDLVALDFGASKVALDQVSIGWYSTDADISVLAWTGAGAPASLSTALNGKVNGGATGLVGNGWTLVGSYTDLQNGPATTNASNITSSWWLISAYNGSYPGGGAFSTGNDYLKILTVSTKDLTKVPEPSSIALAGLAMFGAFAARRKTTNAA